MLFDYNISRATTGLLKHSEIAPLGLVRDGTPCGDNLVCVNQTCTSIFPFIDHTKCPTDHNNNECSAKGVSYRNWQRFLIFNRIVSSIFNKIQ